MNTAEKTLMYMRLFNLISGRDMHMEFENSICKKVMLYESYATAKYLVILLEGGKVEVVSVSCYEIDEASCSITFEGESISRNQTDYYKVSPEDK